MRSRQCTLLLAALSVACRSDAIIEVLDGDSSEELLSGGLGLLRTARSRLREVHLPVGDEHWLRSGQLSHAVGPASASSVLPSSQQDETGEEEFEFVRGLLPALAQDGAAAAQPSTPAIGVTHNDQPMHAGESQQAEHVAGADGLVDATLSTADFVATAAAAHTTDGVLLSEADHLQAPGSGDEAAGTGSHVPHETAAGEASSLAGCDVACDAETASRFTSPEQVAAELLQADKETTERVSLTVTECLPVAFEEGPAATEPASAVLPRGQSGGGDIESSPEALTSATEGSPPAGEHTNIAAPLEAPIDPAVEGHESDAPVGEAVAAVDTVLETAAAALEPAAAEPLQAAEAAATAPLQAAEEAATAPEPVAAEPLQAAEAAAAASEPAAAEPLQAVEAAIPAPEPAAAEPLQGAEEAAAAPEPVIAEPLQAAEAAATVPEPVAAEPLHAAEAAAPAPEPAAVEPLQAAEAAATAPEPVVAEPLQAAEAAATVPKPVVAEPSQAAPEAVITFEPAVSKASHVAEAASAAPEPVIPEPLQAAEVAPADTEPTAVELEVSQEAGDISSVVEPGGVELEVSPAAEEGLLTTTSENSDGEPRGRAVEPSGDDEVREVRLLPSEGSTAAELGAESARPVTTFAHSEELVGTHATGAPQSLVEVQRPAAVLLDARQLPLADASAGTHLPEDAEAVHANFSRALQTIPASGAFSLDAFVARQLESAMEVYAAVSDPVAWTHLRESLIVNGVASFWVGMIALFHCATLYVLYLAPMLVFDYFEHMSRLEALLWKIAFMAALSASAYAFHTHLSFWITLAASLFLTSLLFRM